MKFHVGAQQSDSRVIYTHLHGSWEPFARCALYWIDIYSCRTPFTRRDIFSLPFPHSLHFITTPTVRLLRTLVRRTLVRRRPPLRLGNLGFIPPHALELALIVVSVLQPMLLAALISVGAGQDLVAVSYGAHARGQWRHHCPRRRVCRMRERGNGGRAIDC